MMGTKIRGFSSLPHEVSLEDLVPKDDFYRRLQAVLDLSFVRELVAPLYAGGGRPSVDPVVVFKLQLVMFFEGLRSERQLMRAAADRLSVRWYLGYDLFEQLPDHSSLTRIRDRYGLGVFRRFFERIVEECAEAGLVWGKELYFDATKVEANASLDSVAPRFFVEAHLEQLFEADPDAAESGAGSARPLPVSAPDELLAAANAARHDWIAEEGRQNRQAKDPDYRRISDLKASRTDPDASLMHWSKGGSHLGYHTHYVVDGGKARIVLQALVTPSEVMENQPMLDLLWRTSFRFRLLTRRVTGDAAYGTRTNISSVERAGIRAYVNLKERENPDKRFFPPSAFAYVAERDLFRCPGGQELVPWNSGEARQGRRYKAKAKVCAACSLKPECTPNKRGRTVFRHFDEGYVDRVRAYRETEPYHKVLRKRKVWVEPLFAEAKDWHGLRRFRLRRLERHRRWDPGGVAVPSARRARGRPGTARDEFARAGCLRVGLGRVRGRRRSFGRPRRRGHGRGGDAADLLANPAKHSWSWTDKRICYPGRMELRSGVVALAVGGAFGAATSLINDVSSPYGMIGGQMGDTGWRWAAEVASKLLDAGWAWAGLAVATGWMAGAGARGAAAGVLALLAATTAYFGMDSVLLEGGPEGMFAGYWYEVRFWWLASVVLGLPLGVVGASIGRPGVVGLLAGLTVPVGATVQMIWLTGSSPLDVDPAMDWARVIVWAAAAVGAGGVVVRFGAYLKGRRMPRDGSRD